MIRSHPYLRVRTCLCLLNLFFDADREPTTLGRHFFLYGIPSVELHTPPVKEWRNLLSHASLVRVHGRVGNELFQTGCHVS